MSKTFSALLALSKQLEEKSAGLALECLHAATLLENTSAEEKACSNYLLGELLLKTAQEPLDSKQFFLASIEASQTIIKTDLSSHQYLLRSLEKLSGLLPISESTIILSDILSKHNEDDTFLAKLFFSFLEIFANCGADRLLQVMTLFKCEPIATLRRKSEYIDILINLSNALLILKNYCRAHENLFHDILDEAENKLNTTTIDQAKKASLRIYLHCLRIMNVLTWGIPERGDRKTGKSLKQFHQEIIAYSQLQEEPTTESDLNSFFWLKKEELTALGYLITVIHSVRFGNIDKAIKYSERTLNQVSTNQSFFNDNLRILTLEYLAQCKLIIGEPLECVKIISELSNLAQSGPHPSKICQMHSLIAFLAMSSNQKETALKHFQLALEAKPENESFIKLCISFAKGAPLDPSFSNEESVPLNAITHLISGYAQFSQKDHDSAKRTFRDGVKVSNAQDIKSLTAMYLLLLGEIFISTSSDGYMTTVKQARQMATKIQHESLLVWANRLSLSSGNSADPDFQKIQEELAKLESKRASDEAAIRESALAQTLFNWTSITELPKIQVDAQVKEEAKPEISQQISNGSSSDLQPQNVKQNHALVDQEIDNMISKMEGGTSMMGPPSERPPPSPAAQSPRPVASPRPPPVVSPNVYQNQPVNSPVQYNTQTPSPMSQPTTPHSPFQPVHSPMNPTSPHQSQQAQMGAMMQQGQFNNQNHSPSISPHHPSPSISPKIPINQQNMMGQQKLMPQNVAPTQSLNTGFSGISPNQNNFGNGHFQPQPNPIQQQVPMTQHNYNPFSHTNIIGNQQAPGGMRLSVYHTRESPILVSWVPVPVNSKFQFRGYQVLANALFKFRVYQVPANAIFKARGYRSLTNAFQLS